MPNFSTIITFSLMTGPFSHSPEENVLLRLTSTMVIAPWGGSGLPPVFSIIFSKIINELSNRNNNEVEYCSRVIDCFNTKHKFKKNSRFSQARGEGRGGPVTRYNPRPTLVHNYILRIYLQNDSIITPPSNVERLRDYKNVL